MSGTKKAEERPTWNLQRVLKGLVEEKQETWLDREWIPDDSLPPVDKQITKTVVVDRN